MDKTRDVRRGVSRFSRQIIKQSKQKLLLSGLDGVAEPEPVPVPQHFVSLERPKKERLIKKLSILNKPSSSYEDSEKMSCTNNISDRENEFPSQSQSLTSNGATKRFKPSKKFFDDCNGVDHASVPRKLRSAMKKRNGESISPPLPDSKKLNHTMSGVESTKKDGLKKSKLNMKQGSSDWSLKQSVGPISKDEEEVVETLYALAEMFPDNDSAKRSKLGSAPAEVKPPNLLESSTPATEVRKEELSSTCPLRTSEAASSANIETSLKETAKSNSLNEPTTEEKSEVLVNKNCHMKPDSCVPQVNLHNMMPPLAKKEYMDDKPSCNPIKFQVLPETHLDSGLKQPTHVEGSLDRKPELTLGATCIGSQLVQQDIVKDSRKSGLALWPGLSPMVLHGAGSSSPSQSFTPKNPAWLDAAICTSSPCSFETGPSTGQVLKGATDRRSWRNSTAHVYISRLIRDLQIPERKEKSPIQPNQLKPSYEGQKQGIFMAINDFQRINNGLNGVILSNNIVSTPAERYSNEANKNGILQHKRLYQDQQQTTSSEAHNWQKQSFDFLSLSAGGGGTEATNRTINNGLEPSSRFQLSCLSSVAQHQKFIPLSMPQTHYTSVYPDQLSASASASTQQVQLQLPSYLSSPFHGPHRSSSTVLTKQQHQQQQQQQLWAAQLAAHYRPAGTSTTMNQFPSWINGRQDPTLIHCHPSIIAPSTSSMEVLGPKYAATPQQQQQPQLVAITSIPPARAKRQDHHLPSVYEEIEGGFRTGVALPLQLLCNERL